MPNLILSETHGPVLLLRLNRPEALNALNVALMQDLTAMLLAADADAAVRCILLTGSEKAFAAGADVREMQAKTYAEALKAATAIAAKSALAVMAAKEAVNRSQETTLAEGLLYERRQFHAMFGTEDQKEGMAAFIDKRSAKFRDM